MRLLILDDEESRHEALARQYVDWDKWHVYSAARAIFTLGICRPFDVATLDHDLGGVKAITLSETGQAVCRYVSRWPGHHGAAVAPYARLGVSNGGWN